MHHASVFLSAETRKTSVGGHTVDETPLGCLLSSPDKWTRSIRAEENIDGEPKLITYGRVQVRLDSHEVHAVIAQEDLHDLWAQNTPRERDEGTEGSPSGSRTSVTLLWSYTSGMYTHIKWE